MKCELWNMGNLISSKLDTFTGVVASLLIELDNNTNHSIVYLITPAVINNK